MRDAAKPPRLRLVLPCYNEAARLDPGAFLAFVGSAPDVALLFVDDGSRDGTARMLAELAARSDGQVEVLTLPRNAGKAAAVQRGITAALKASPELVGYWDSDLSTPLAELPAFVAALDANPRLDLVIGSRVRLLGRDIRRSAARHYVGRVFATAASLALRLPVYDTQCGAKVFRVSERVRQVFSSPFRSDWIFDVELLGRLLALVGPAAGGSVEELPLRVWNDVPGSKVRLTDGVAAAWHLLRLRSFVKQWRAGLQPGTAAGAGAGAS